MAATPIPTHLIHTVFQYIFPPSLPLPRHLLSQPLIRRHHFVGVSPTDPVSYLSWPSPHAAQVGKALEFSFSGDIISQSAHDVRYSAPDQETLLAHVRPHSTSPLQTVFAWDSATESWRYHDVRILPFPDGSLSSLDAVLAQRQTNVAILEISPSNAEVSHGTGFSSPISDDYWAGYDSSSPSLTTPAPSNIITEEEEKAETAYWASYGGVHGSGDSTMPSPTVGKKHLSASQKRNSFPEPDTPIDPLLAHLHLRLHEHNGFSNYQLDAPSSDYSRPVNLGPVTSSGMCGKDEESGGGSSKCHLDTHEIAVDPLHFEMSKDRQEVDEGVKDAARGLYRMWKAHTSLADTEVFMEIVKSAIETL